MKPNADRQFEPGYRRQVGDALLHVDSSLAGILGSIEGGEQFIAGGLHGPTPITVNRTLHAFQAALNRMNCLCIPEPFKQRGTASDIGIHHDLVTGGGAHGRQKYDKLLKLGL